MLELTGPRFSVSRLSAGDTTAVFVLSPVKRGPGCPARLGSRGLLREAVLAEDPRGTRLRLRFEKRCLARHFRLDAQAKLPPRLVIDLVAAPAADVASRAVPAAAPPAAGMSRTTPASAPVASAPPSPTPSLPGSSSPDSPPDSTGALPATDPGKTGPRVVVLDPGHGGNDPGATAKGLQEKEVCLDVARRLAVLLDHSGQVRAVLTRRTDQFIPLRERMRFAEKENADLFVSIHVNAARDKTARGVEVFFLSVGAASDQASRELARLENQADPDYVVEEDGALSQLPFLLDLRQSDTMLRSSRAAEVMLRVLTREKLAEARGVKQAGFAVLKSFQVPSILVELGFISSPRDRVDLKSSAHRAEIAETLAEGIRRYFERYAPQRAAR